MIFDEALKPRRGYGPVPELSERYAGDTPGSVHAVTDVTGFGLLGHAREMAIGSGVSLEIDHSAIEYLPGAIAASRGGFHSAGLRNNREFVGDCVRFAATVPQEFRHLLFDPQTSGGLLIALDSDHGRRRTERISGTQRRCAAYWPRHR